MAKAFNLSYNRETRLERKSRPLLARRHNSPEDKPDLVPLLSPALPSAPMTDFMGKPCNWPWSSKVALGIVVVRVGAKPSAQRVVCLAQGHLNKEATPGQRAHTGLKRRYPADVFSELNKLNVSLQVSSSLNLYDKPSCGEGPLHGGEFTCFPQLEDVLSNEDEDRAPVKLVTVGHFTNFHSHGGYISRAGSGEKPIYSVRSKWKQATCHLSGNGKRSWTCHLTVASR
ncbi:hypothetical protein EYF80_033798 [Liparis tanakae]|uniref:Uncharacterized protein n=1 Tax=Liparis tanakae TaxID=230148 RepID=A0A4Z2GT38_9TELE|nr:hypothetical protein EYF80_033798 [Liparis tanakae]